MERNELEARLDSTLEEQYGGPDGDHMPESWSITGMDEAAWASRKAATCEQSIAVIDAWEKREIARIKAVASKERDRFARDEEFFVGHLRRYLEHLIEEGRPTKSLELPGGKVALRTRQPLVDVGDEGRALRYAEKNGRASWLRVKTSLDKTAFKKDVELADGGKVVDPLTGEILTFARWEHQDDSVTFTPVEGG